MSNAIFINYRHGDDPGFTQALYQRLEQDFSVDDLFMDVEGQIKPGDDFLEVLNAQVAKCDVLLVVIGPRWAELLAARSGEPSDFVLIEITAALNAGKRVIPVLVGGAEMPRAEALPSAIRSLARRNAVDLRPTRFRNDCQGLVVALKGLLAAAAAEHAARFNITPDSDELRRHQGRLESYPGHPPPNYAQLASRSIPIICAFSRKGGTGKTVAIANLAGALVHAKQKRVLLVDFDPQATLSYLYMKELGIEHWRADAGKLIDPDSSINDIVQAMRRAEGDYEGLSLMTSAAELREVELKAFASWESHGVRDPRYIAANFLFEPVLQGLFDLILIDLPPPSSLLMLNALAASTHAIIPTTMDAISLETLRGDLRYLKECKTNFCPSLKLLGGLISRYQATYGHEEPIAEAATKLGQEAWGVDFSFFGTRINQRMAVAERGLVFRGTTSQANFERFASEVLSRVE